MSVFKKNNFLIFSWGLYDLANQFFALNVISLYFVQWLTLEKQAPEILYSISFGISTFFVAFFAPVLGTISDLTARRRPFLVFLTMIAVAFTMFLGIGKILPALIFFIIANFGCQTAIVFYNAMLVNIAPKNKIGLVSGIGKMFGYSGAIIALLLIKPVVLKSGYQATFLPTGILFFIFALPCMVFVKDKQPRGRIEIFKFLKKEKIRQIFKSLKETATNTARFPGLLDFLKASFFGLCAVNAVILFMSVYASRAFGLDKSEVMVLITFSTFFAILGSIASGFISDYVGHKKSMCAVFILWGLCFFIGAFSKNFYLYRVIGAIVGIALGSTWVVSRALAIRLVPEEKIGEVFGLFNLVGYLSAIVGALFWGLLLLLLSSFGEWGYRMTLLSLTVFMLLGFYFLMRIPTPSKIKSRDGS